MTVKHHYNKKHSRIVLLPVLLLLLSGCSADYLYDDSAYYDEGSWNAEASVLNGSALNEDKGIYDVYADELAHLYLKIQPGKDAEQGGCSLFLICKIIQKAMSQESSLMSMSF